MKRFSKEELFLLRNEIDINTLIYGILNLPSKQNNGKKHFQCPLCSNFHTSTKKDTNLARCFNCDVNFNTIEIVMEVKKADFYPSAKFLMPFLDQKFIKKNPISLESPPYSKYQQNKPTLAAESIHLVAQNCSPIKKNYLNKGSMQKKSENETLNSVRLNNIEKKLNSIENQFKMLKKFVINEFVKKTNNNTDLT